MFTDVARVTASQDGYVPETQTFPPVNRPPSFEGGTFDTQFYLAPTSPPIDISGSYTLTMIADQTCRSVPADARTRSYTAAIAPGVRTWFFTVRLSDARFPSTPCPPGQPLDTCTYDRLGIGLACDYARVGVGMVERLDENTFLVFDGAAEGAFEPDGITAPFSGVWLYCPAEPVWNDGWSCQTDGALQCDSRNHQLTLTRR